jgi:hypothetical protein
MKQPALDLYDVPPGEKRPWRRVRDTSRAAYADGRERFTGRKAFTLRVLAAYWHRFQAWPTSAELAAQDDMWAGDIMRTWDAQLLLIRRGLSDLQAAGVVEAVPQGQRRCRMTGRRCEVWRVVSR